MEDLRCGRYALIAGLAAVRWFTTFFEIEQDITDCLLLYKRATDWRDATMTETKRAPAFTKRFMAWLEAQ
eukprot:7840921-Heterocapsa_arctica.AAC.1